MQDLGTKCSPQAEEIPAEFVNSAWPRLIQKSLPTRRVLKCLRAEDSILWAPWHGESERERERDQEREGVAERERILHLLLLRKKEGIHKQAAGQTTGRNWLFHLTRRPTRSAGQRSERGSRLRWT